MELFLILTNNIIAEQPVQKQLQELNHEVLCSSELLKYIQRKEYIPSLVFIFRYIILGRTISDKEGLDILKSLKGSSVIVLRECENYPSKKMVQEWDNNGLCSWVKCGATLEETRESISKAERLEKKVKTSYGDSIGLTYPETTIWNSRKRSISLSKVEQRISKILYKANGDTISRKELCFNVWPSGMTKSNLSQLSSVVSRINRKIYKVGFSIELIETIWGNGYRMNMDLYHQINLDHHGLESLMITDTVGEPT